MEATKRLDEVEASKPGGRLDLGIVGCPGHIGVGLDIDHRMASPDLSMYAHAEATYGSALRSWDWQASAGLRLRW